MESLSWYRRELAMGCALLIPSCKCYAKHPDLQTSRSTRDFALEVILDSANYITRVVVTVCSQLEWSASLSCGNGFRLRRRTSFLHTSTQTVLGNSTDTSTLSDSCSCYRRMKLFSLRCASCSQNSFREPSR